MNLASTIELYAGGPGSGCNPDKGKCGRPKGKEAFREARRFFSDRPKSEIQDLIEYSSLEEAFEKIRSALQKAGYKTEHILDDEDFDLEDPGLAALVRMVELTTTKGKDAINVYIRTDGKRTFALFDEVPLSTEGGLHMDTPFTKVPKPIKRFLR